MATNTGPGGAVQGTKPTTGGTPSPSTTPPTTGPPAGTLTPDQQSANTSINEFFAQFGLTDLAQWAWNAYLNGTPIEQVFLDAQQRPEWKARFPAMDELAKQGRAITPAAYIEWEQRAVSLFQAYGLPKGFYDDPTDFKDIMVAGVGMPELEQRIQLAAKAQYSVPQSVRDELKAKYGIDDGALTAYWLDPNRAAPLLENQFTAAQISAQAKGTGFGNINRDQAELLAAEGVTDDTAKQGFGTLTGLGQVLTETLAGEQSLTRDQQLAAVFGGDAEASRAIQARQAGRLAAFQSGGGFTTKQTGRTGVGTQEG